MCLNVGCATLSLGFRGRVTATSAAALTSDIQAGIYKSVQKGGSLVVEYVTCNLFGYSKGLPWTRKFRADLVRGYRGVNLG